MPIMRKLLLSKALLSFTLGFVLLILSSPASYSEEKAKINLQDVDIRTLIETVSRISGKNFIVDPRVKGQKVTVITGKALGIDELYDTFLSILDVHGYAAVTSGDIIKIIPSNQAKQNPLPVVDGDDSNAKSDELITRVVRVEHVPVAQLVPILRPLIPNNGQLQAYGPSNTLLISDRASNIERVIEVIKRMDRADDEQIEVVPLKHSTAANLVKTMQSLQKKGTGATAAPSKSRVSADERTNSILIAGNKSARKRVKDIIEKLDTERTKQEDGTKVIRLRYAKAADLVKVLQGMSGAQQQQVANEKGQTITKAAAISILADTTSNSVIITASPALQKNLIKVVKQLDIPQKQVLVEAIIAEVSTDLSSELGIQMGALNKNKGLVAGTNFAGASPSLAEVAIAAATNSIPSLSSGLLLGLAGSKFAVLLKALKGDAATNILSTPTLVTVNNEEASIVVGQNVPFVTGQFSNTSTTGGSTNPTNPFQTIERQDVGITLKVTPQINVGNTIKLKIEQEVSSLSSSSVSASDLITNKRLISTNVIVDNGQILVLGGLIEDTFRDTETKVPILGSLPGVGKLFRHTTTTKVKQNLMAFIHPVILRNGQTADTLSRKKYADIQKRQLEANLLKRGELKSGAVRLPNIDEAISHIDPPQTNRNTLPAVRLPEPAEILPRKVQNKAASQKADAHKEQSNEIEGAFGDIF
jgi:general secretion pathway protein D